MIGSIRFSHILERARLLMGPRRMSGLDETRAEVSAKGSGEPRPRWKLARGRSGLLEGSGSPRRDAGPGDVLRGSRVHIGVHAELVPELIKHLELTWVEEAT